ncbi:MAG: CbbQ/NirQ/NorQ C-terminal domain-containing protein [Steroidobacteraceae bacterium]
MEDAHEDAAELELVRIAPGLFCAAPDLTHLLAVPAALPQAGRYTVPLADKLIGLALAIRGQDDIALREVASTRTLIAAAALMREGVPALDAVRAAMIAPLSDEREVEVGLMEIAKAVFG